MYQIGNVTIEKHFLHYGKESLYFANQNMCRNEHITAHFLQSSEIFATVLQKVVCRRRISKS